jgi:hypothetical protein
MSQYKQHRPVSCYFCDGQMYYDGDDRHEPEVQVSYGDRAADYAHRRCLNAALAAFRHDQSTRLAATQKGERVE